MKTSGTKSYIEDVYNKITSRAVPSYDSPKAFICESDLRQVWSEKENIQHVLGHSSNQNIDHVKEKQLKIISILVLIGVSDIEKAFSLLCCQDSLLLTDDHLPLQKDHLNCLGSFSRDQFLQKQYILMPIVIENHPKAKLMYKEARCPFPFMETKSSVVGAGGYGSVYKNKIAPQYVRDMDTGLVNSQVYPTSCHLNLYRAFNHWCRCKSWLLR